MRTSIFKALALLGLSLLLILLLAPAALAGSKDEAPPMPIPAAELLPLKRASIGVLPLRHLIPSTGEGLSTVLADELAASGRYEVCGPELCLDFIDDESALLRLSRGGPGSAIESAMLASHFDYLLAGSLDVIDISDKDVKLDLGAEFRDLSAMINGGNRIAQVRLSLHLYRCADGQQVWSGQCEGLESQRGLRRQYSSIGWLAGQDIASDEFRQSMLGRAAFKAVGAALRELYAALPLEARVLAVTPSAVVLNLDEQAGLSAGEELQVFAIDELQNSSGISVWSSERRVGSVQIVQFQQGRALCLILDGAAEIAEGDLARPLSEPQALPLETDRL